MHIIESQKQERFFLFSLAGIQFTHILDFMIMMPLGPQFISVLNINRISSVYCFLLTFLRRLQLEYWQPIMLTRFERRQLLLSLYVFFTIVTLACGLSPNYETLFIARAFAGAFGGILGS